jgi:hypothetical protein
MAATTYWHDLRPECPRGEFHYISKILETINKDPDATANDGFFDAVGINLYLGHPLKAGQLGHSFFVCHPGEGAI